MEPIQVAEIRSKGWSYRAEMYPIYKPSYVGAAPLTKYFVFNREWKEVPYNSLPTSAYQALRRALRVDMAKGPMRDPQKPIKFTRAGGRGGLVSGEYYIESGRGSGNLFRKSSHEEYEKHSTKVERLFDSPWPDTEYGEFLESGPIGDLRWVVNLYRQGLRGSSKRRA